MKEGILDVLLYLFEHGLPEGPESAGDRASLHSGLLDAGFSQARVGKALDWLDTLAGQRPGIARVRGGEEPVRVYTGAESDRLDVHCRGFLMSLEHAGVLDGGQRELVLDRVLALDHDEVGLDELKWVVLMVLSNQPGAEAAYAWMESRMFGDEAGTLH